jgi:hypothetical protein
MKEEAQKFIIQMTYVYKTITQGNHMAQQLKDALAIQ